MIAHCGLANARIHDGVHFVAYANSSVAPSFRVFCGGGGFYDHLMSPDALYRVITTLDLSHHRIQFIAI